MRSLSDILKSIETECTGEKISVANLLETFHERGFGFFLFIFALPAALPLPAVGVGTILGIPLVFLTAQQAIGRHTIWFPAKMKQKGLKRETVMSMIEGALPWVTRIEKLIKPRFSFVTEGAFSRMIGIFGFIMALSVCVPLPLTNTVPSFGIALMSIGVIMRDGLAVLAGAIIGMIWVTTLTMVILFLGTEGIGLVKDLIKGLL